jgi:cytochrome d ubiquinol oxidase subunit II
VQPFVARTDEEKHTVIAAIGPLWDGNEVWLIAGGGVFVFAFPRAYAAAFSGLYLALMIVLWLLVLRGVAIEFRSKAPHPLWRSAWDSVFAGSSGAMALVLGVALGNLVRGVPMDPSGHFHEDLFGESGSMHAGAIDLYTAVVGLFALATLGAHGATFLAWKTTGPLAARSIAAARRLWIACAALLVLTTVVTAVAVPVFFASVLARPWLWPLPLAALALALFARREVGAGRELRAFLASCAFIASLLVATAGALFPVILRSTTEGALTLDAYNAASDPASLERGLFIWVPAIVLAIGYFTYIFRAFRGKADPSAHHY